MNGFRVSLCVLSWCLIAAFADPGSARAARAELVVGGFDQPVFVATPPGDERLFVVERAGRIRIVTGAAIQEPPFLDIRDRVDTEREGGLTGLAFPDDYATTGRFYVYYTHGVPGVADRAMTSRVSAFQAIGAPATASAANAAQEQVLWSLALPNTIHHGGTIAIRDGDLLLALGDGGGATSEEGAYDPDEVAQDPGVPLGKLLALDLSATPPLTPQLLAKGFRNPYRFSLDALTGDLYLGDVGQDTREEIDVLPAGFTPAQGCGPLPNYGWDVVEGSVCWGPDAPGEPACNSSCLIAPIHEYAHAAGPGCGGAVTCGVVYRGSALPAWQGLYVFGDFCSGRVFSLRWTPAAGAGDLVERTAELQPEDGPLARITGFGEDADGELYFTSAGDFSPSGGRLYRVPEPVPHALGWLAVASFGALVRVRLGRG
jgi:glucose/arabinose dehydrogenase